MNYDIFREELAAKYPAYGHALWEPSPGGRYTVVDIGDVGFIREGYFHRLFNILLPEDHPSHQDGVPQRHEPLVLRMSSPTSIGTLQPNDLRSNGVSDISDESGRWASGPDEAEQHSFSCSRRRGAILSLPVPVHRKDTAARGDFAKYITKHINEWFAFTQERGLGIGREDIILVTGCHLTRTWATVAFQEREEQVSFGVQVYGVSNVTWQFTRKGAKGVAYNLGPSGQDLPENQCIFVRGFRVILFSKILPLLRGAAGPDQLPGEGDPDPDPQLNSIPTETHYQDPLHTLMEYIATQAPDCDIALVHDDDLQCIENASLESLRPDTMVSYLQKSAPEIWHLQCGEDWSTSSHSDLGASEVGAPPSKAVTKVATLSKNAFGAPEDYLTPDEDVPQAVYVSTSSVPQDQARRYFSAGPSRPPQSYNPWMPTGSEPEYSQSTSGRQVRDVQEQCAAPVRPSPLPPFARNEPWGFETPSGDYYERICTAIGLYDYSSSDPDHLSFRKHDILEIIRQDESGWWGAVRSDGSEIGWIPAKFVRALSDEAAHRVYEIRERTQIPKFLADPENARTAPPLSMPIVETPSSSGTAVPDEPSDTSPPQGWSDLSVVIERPRTSTAIEIPDHLHDSPPNTVLHEIEDPPAPPVSLTIVPPVSKWPKPFLKLDKSLPASPDGTNPLGSAGAEHKIGAHRRNSCDGAVGLPDNLLSLPAPSTMRAHIFGQLPHLVRALDVPASPFSKLFTPNARPRPGKALQLTGDDSAQAFYDAKQTQENFPWYLRRRHSEEEIKLEFDGTVEAGTLPALVEHLVVDALRASQQETFRRAFLATFRTFATATEVFDLLVAQYELCVPPNLSEEEFRRWNREKQRPTQKRVLTVLTMWLEEYDLLDQDPEVPPKLQDFLCLIVNPPALALTAKHILKSLERLTFAKPSVPEAVVLSSRKWKKVQKEGGLELVRMDPLEVAQHLSMFEFDMYRKIRSQECFLWSKVKEGDAVKNIHAFCATLDRLADWVKCSILEVPVLGKRANVLDFWIRVAEKCRSLNNFSSMSSIVAALSSVLISRLNFTWVNSSREHALEPLRKIIHPASNYGYYRNILEAVEGPCVPFVGPFLKSIIYAQEQHADNVFVQSATDPERHFTLIHFVKRQKWYDITLQMLRFQAKPYYIPEIPEMTSFITGQMEKAATLGERWYWQRSDELQHAELVHADIRRGLEAAGF